MRKNLFIILSLVFIFYPLSFIIHPSLTYAQFQPPFDFSTSPEHLEITANPGDTIKKSIRIRNNTESAIPLKIDVKKLIADSKGNVVIRDPTALDTYISWLTIDDGSVFVARPKEWTDVPFTIAIPKTAAFGYYYSLYITPKDTPIPNKATVVTGAIGIPILVNVAANNAVIKGNITAFSTNSNWYEYPPVTFFTTFMNRGNIHIKPHGTIFITDWRKKTIATLDINAASSSVLPLSRRIFDSTWNDGFITIATTIEDGKTQNKLAIHFDKLLDLRLGKYTAHALVVVSTDKQDIPYEATSTFWVFPWKILLGVVIFILLAGIGLINTGKSIWNTIRKIFQKKL